MHAVLTSILQGKTVLLRTLLGENFVVSGSSNLTQGKVAYAPQEAFIWPTTVRENIILDGIYEPGWYNTVVKACALEDDFSQMEKGDMTVMTSGSGSSVSGGQKQRIVRNFLPIVICLADFDTVISSCGLCAMRGYIIGRLFFCIGKYSNL